MRGFISPVAPNRSPRFHHEGPVLPEVGEGPPPRLQGRPSPWQGLRDLQVQPALQGAPALSAAPAGPSGGQRDRGIRGRSNAALFLSDAGLVPVSPGVGPTRPGRPRSAPGVVSSAPAPRTFAVMRRRPGGTGQCIERRLPAPGHSGGPPNLLKPVRQSAQTRSDGATDHAPDPEPRP